MMLGMQLLVDLEILAQILDDLLGQPGVGFVLATGIKEHQLLSTQCLLLHDAGGSGCIAETIAPSSFTALILYRGLYILIVKVKHTAERGVSFVIGATETDAGLPDVIE